MLMTLLFERRLKCESWDQEGIVPRAAASIKRMKEKRNDYIVRPSSINEYQVEGMNEIWTVNLADKTCDCRVWVVTGIPCIHAVCVNYQRRLNWVEFCNEYHLVSTYSKVYEKAISPLPNHRTWPKFNFAIYIVEPDVTVLPPHQYRPPGRPTKNRKRGYDEGETWKRQRKCKKCGMMGHNTRTCKGAPKNARGRGAACTSTRGRGEAGPSTSGRGKSTPLTRGMGSTRGRGGSTSGRGSSRGRGTGR